MAHIVDPQDPSHVLKPLASGAMPAAAPDGGALATAAAQAAQLAALQAPLKLQPAYAASGVTPLTGSTAVSAVSAAFTPALGREIALTLSGTWAGTVKLMRSTDAGVTKLPVTAAGQPWAQFTGNCNETVWIETESGATLYLDITVTSGTVVYRMAQ